MNSCSIALQTCGTVAQRENRTRHRQSRRRPRDEPHSLFASLLGDNIWLFARDTTTLQTMVDEVTHSVHHNLGMHWKPKSMQIMHAAQLHRRHRNTVTVRAPGSHRLKFDPCSGMKVLGSWCDDSGGSTGALVASLQTGNMRILQIRGTAKGSQTAHRWADKGILALPAWPSRCTAQKRFTWTVPILRC